MRSDNLPQQFQTVKDDDEEFLWVGEPSFIPFICTGIPFLLFGLLWGAFDYFGFIIHMPKDMAGFAIPFFAIHLFPFWGSILNELRLILVHKNTFYAITSKRIMLTSGFWGIDFKAIDYDQIADVQVTVNPLENIFQVGTLRFSTGRSSRNGNQLTGNFLAIPDPYTVFKKVKSTGVDIKTDWYYPNKLRPEDNPGYRSKYRKK